MSDDVGTKGPATRTLTVQRGRPAAGRRAATNARAPLERAPGSLVDRFSILGPLGSGGLGDVFAAYDPELDRKVALKLLRGVGPENTARLLREAQAMARLRHPNVITVYDVGVDAGEVFVAMELVDGATLATWLREAPRRWTDVRDVMVAAGRGLEASHTAGVVHRDFKPDNVMLDRDGRVVVLDFGLAHRHGDPDDVDASVTDGDAVLGTLPYMAPELFSGAPGSPASDQFAFCVAVWEGVHGCRPFGAADSVEAHLAAVEGGPDETARNARAPRWLQAALMRGLDPRPEHRHASIDALLLALCRDLRRRRRGVLAGVLVAVLGAGLGAAATVMLRPEPTPEQRASIDQLGEQARLAAARGHFLHPPVDQPDEPTALHHILALEQVDGPAAEASHDAAVRLRAELAQRLFELAERHAAQPGGDAFAADFFAAALVFDPAHEGARARMVMTPGQLATLELAAERGEFSRAELVAAEPLVLLADAARDRRLDKLATLYAREQGISATTRERLRGLLDPAESHAASQAEHDRLATAHDDDDATLDPEASVSRDADTAEGGPDAAALEPAAAPADAPAGLGEAVGEEPPSRAGDDLAHAGRAALARGDLDEAEARFHQALRIDRNDVAALEGLADVSFQRGEYARAADFARRAVRRKPSRAGLHLKLGDAYFKVLRYDDAATAYRAARELGSEVASARLELVEARIGEPATR